MECATSLSVTFVISSEEFLPVLHPVSRIPTSANTPRYKKLFFLIQNAPLFMVLSYHMRKWGSGYKLLFMQPADLLCTTQYYVKIVEEDKSR